MTTPAHVATHRSPATPLRRRRSADLRALIVDAAQESFAASSYAGTTMGEVAARAGVTRSVLTRHFPTKADLFREIVTQPVLRFATEWTERWTDRVEPAPSEDAVYEFISDLLRNSRRHVGALRMLMFAGEELDEEFTTHVWATLNEGLAAVMSIAVRQIGGRGYPTEHAEVTVRAIMSMVVGYVILDPALLPGPPMDDDALLRHLAALILYGLRLAPAPDA